MYNLCLDTMEEFDPTQLYARHFSELEFLGKPVISTQSRSQNIEGLPARRHRGAAQSRPSKGKLATGAKQLTH